MWKLQSKDPLSVFEVFEWSESKIRLLSLETVCRLKESLLLGVMGGGPGEEEELEEEEGGPGETERRRSPPNWLRT